MCQEEREHQESHFMKLMRALKIRSKGQEATFKLLYAYSGRIESMEKI